MPRGGPVFRSEVVKAPKAPGALTAAAKVYQNGPGAQSIRKQGRRARSIEYQNDLWDFYDTVPEFRFACSWVGSLLSKVRLNVTYKGKPTTNQAALDALASLFGGPEGQAEMMRLLGINFTVCGEAFVVGKPDPSSHQDDWQVIASVEVSNNGTTLTIEQEPIDDETLAIRLWRVHPRRSSEADSPSRALMPVLAEIVMLTQVVNAQGSSRLTSSGILWIPSEIEMPALPVTEESIDPDAEISSIQEAGNAADAVTTRLVKIASIAIGDRSSAAANVPFVIAAPGEHLEKIQKTEFWSGFDEHAKTLRDEAIRRVGVGMDMPPEVLTGTGEINHWGAWSVEEAAIKSHTEPLIDIIVNSLSTGYLHAWLESEGVEDWENYAFDADTTELRLRPNRSKEAMELWDRGAISIETLLRENGFDPDTDRPDEAERIMFFLMKVAEKTSATPQQLAAALQQLGVKGIPAGEDARGAIEPRRSLEDHPSQDIPVQEESEAGNPRGLNASGQPVIIDPLVLACEAHVHRALERAGNRLKNRVDGRVGRVAADLYLTAPQMDFKECEALLEDAWGMLDRFEYPGISTERLREALNEYTLFLLRTQKPMSRATLARHLMLELADAA
jgi:hypothetical protein